VWCILVIRPTRANAYILDYLVYPCLLAIGYFFRESKNVRAIKKPLTAPLFHGIDYQVF